MANMLKKFIPSFLLFFILAISSFAALDVDSTDFYERVAEGNVEGYSIIHKFGTTLLDTSIHPATASTFYRTPITGVNLEFLSNDADDTALGNGAREITIECLNSTFQKEIQVINTAGTTPVPLTKQCTRLYRWYVSNSGTYATQTTGSHEGDLTIREVATGDVWSTISSSPFPSGQSQIGVYSCEKGKTAYLLSKIIFIDSSKTADVYFFRRTEINKTTAPYSTMRLIQREVGVSGGFTFMSKVPKKICECPCDMGFMGDISVGTSEASFEFEILLVDNNLTTTSEGEEMSLESSFGAIAIVLVCALIIASLLWIVNSMDDDHGIYKALVYLIIFVIFIIAGATVTATATGLVLYKLSLWLIPITFIYILIYLFYKYYAKKY